MKLSVGLLAVLFSAEEIWGFRTVRVMPYRGKQAGRWREFHPTEKVRALVRQ